MWRPCNYSESDMQAASLTASCLYGNLLVLAEFLLYFHLSCGMDGFLVIVITSSGRLLCSNILYVLELKDHQFTSFGPVQTKPVQSKTASLWSSPVQPSGRTGLDWALPQTGSVQTGGIIACTIIYKIKHSIRLHSWIGYKYYTTQYLPDWWSFMSSWYQQRIRSMTECMTNMQYDTDMIMNSYKLWNLL